MKRRLFSLFLALTLVVGMLPAPAFAQETESTQATQAPTEASTPTEAPRAEPTQAPTEAPTEAPAAEPTQPVTEAQSTEPPVQAFTEPAQDEAVAAVQAMIDALPDVEDMSESYLDALEAAYSAFDALSETQQAQITGVEKLEALFGWVNSQVSTLAAEEPISGEVNWNNRTITTPVKLTGDTTLTLVGDNKIECDQPLDLNGKNLTIQGTGTLELVGKGGNNNYRVDATLCDSTYTSYNSGGALTLAGGTVKVSGSDQNAVCVYNLKLNGGKLEAYGGSNAGIACAILQTTSGSLYATGDDYGISMYRPSSYDAAVNKLTILVSNKGDADPAVMESADEKAIKNAGVGDFRTVYIGEVTGPMLSVKAQKGYLYEGTADQTATFAISAQKVDMTTLKAQWVGDHSGLTESLSDDGKTLTVTTDATVKQGTYSLTVTVTGTDGTQVSKTVTVTVLGGPITVTTQPQDASVSCKGGDLDAWQGDKKIQVTATRAEGLTEDITYQWKLEDGTELDNCTGYELFLQDLFVGGKLPQVADKSWLHSAKVHCTLTCGSYSVDTAAVTLTVNTCEHGKANHDGTCQQCGEPCSSEPLLVREDGAYYAVDTSGIGDAEVGGGILTSGGTFYLTKDVLSRDMNAGNYTAGSENVILDLQDHTLNRLKMGNFPYGSFTLKNGTLGVIQTAASGKLILENILYQGKWFDEEFDLTVQGENTRFERQVTFWGTTHLRGGHFDQGLDSNCVDRALELLEDGFAFYDDNGKVVDATDSTKLVGREIHVAAHPTCQYHNGKCDCGRSCDHQGTVSAETGLCQECGSQVYEANVTTADGTVTGYRTLEEALRNGRNATVKLLADCVVKEREEAFCVEVPLTLDLNGKRMEGPSGLIVKKGPTTIRDSSPAQTGTIAGTSDWEYSGMGLGVFNNANVTLTILGGHFEGKTDGLQLLGQNTLILKGGSFSGIHFKEGAAATLRDSLAPGYAYYKADNTLYDPGDGQEATVRLRVGAHPEHTLDSNGHCPCGYTAAATLATEAGKQYFADFSAALDAAKAASGSTLTLFRDVTHSGDSSIYIDSGTFTIDWNGHTLSGETSNDLLLITSTANVTLTDSVGTGGVHNTDGAAIGVYVRSQGSLTIRGGVYSPQLWKGERAYGSIRISGGRFENPEDSGRNGALYCYSGSLADLLAPGYTFAYEDDDSLFDVYGAKMPVAYRTVYAVAHTHESFDEDGVCDCGYTCPHEHWTDGMCDLCGKICPHDHYENGKCAVCGYPCPHEDVTENGGVYTCDNCGLTMTVMVETADGNVSYTTDLAAALNNAENGTTVKLLGDVSLENSAYIKDGKEVTLNLNGHNITRAGWKIIQVQGNTDDGTKAKLVITGSGEIRFNVKAADGGQLDMSDWTGTVTCVDLENACDLVGPIGNGHLGELNISNWRSDNRGTILLQGGTIGKLWLNSFESFQMTLGSLLKSGYAAKSGSEYLPYDYAIQKGGSVDDLTIEPCPHTGLDSSGRCTYCNATGFVASVTKDGVTAGYTDFQSALSQICNGKRGTLKLLTHVNLGNAYQYVISGTLDLNGKDLAGKLVCTAGSNLQIVNSGSHISSMAELSAKNGANVTIADTAGSILFDMVTVESGSVADLLPEGGVYFRTDMRTWISAAEAATKQTLGSVVVREAPVKSVTLTANKTSVPYGESQTVTLTASATLSEGETASYAWAEVKSDGTVQTFPEEAGTSFTLPAGVNAGEHTYRVSVTVGDYTLSKDIQITVTKAKGILENKDYPTEFTYGQTVPTPKAENFTTNNPDGTFSYYWLTGDGSIRLETGANPTRAGTYMLCATWTGGTNYTTASLSLAVTIQKAPQTANITVVNETISGKGDGGVNLLPSAEGYEMREKGETTFEPVPASQGQTFVTLAPGVAYEIRLAETKNYQPSATQEVTVQPGRKLTVTLPENPEGYTLTASKTQLDWHEDVELSFQLDSVGAYKAADFGIWAEAGSEKTKLTLGNDGAVKLTAPEKDITITVTGVKTDNVAPQASIRGRLRKDSGYYVKWEGFQENPADDFVNGDFVISATDRLSGVADFWYYLSDKPLTLEELKGMNGAFWARPANQGKVSITEDGEYYLYAKALDKANNAGYACTGKLVKESNPPTFSGVKDGETYYVSQQMEIHDDGMPDWYMAKGSIGVVPNGGDENPIKLRLKNDGRPYTFTVGDRCGNEATITVYMKPLSDLTQPLDSILEDTIRKSDRATLDDVEATLKGLNVTYATEGEKEEINRALARIAQLRQVLDQVAEVEAQIDALPDSVEPYQQTVEDTQIKPARKAYSDLTDHQKTLVDSAKLDKLVRLEAQLDTWTITEGDGQIWYKGSGKSLSFTVNGQSRKVIGVRLENGNMLGKAMLTVSDSTDAPFTIALKPEYLQCREPGEHSFAVIYRDGETDNVTFTVKIPANYLDVTGREEFDGKTTVTVDGKEYPIEEMGGERYVNLPETGDLLTVYSFKDGTPTGSYTNYPTGMQVFRITRQEGGAKAEEITEFANLLNYAGCSIRVSGKKGIRMITGIDQNVKKSLVSKAGLAGYTLEEYGTVVQWADTLGSNTLNLDTSNKKNYAYKKGKADPIFAKENGMIQYTNVLVGFTDAQCQPDLVMRPYIKLIDTATGETVTLYGGSVTRSIGYVAWQNRDTYKQGTASYKYVWKIINSVDTSKYPN